MLNSFKLLLAQADQAVAGAAGTIADPNANTKPAEPPTWLNAIGMYIPLILLAYFFLIRPSITQQRKAADQMSKLKKNDRVLTRAGIYGTIFSIDRDKNIATIKIDEATNTKIDIALNSIENVVSDSEEKAKV